MLLAAGIAASLVMAACTPAQQQHVAELAATAQSKIVKACNVVQPQLLDLSASFPADPNLKLLAADNGKLCKAASSLDPTDVKSLVNTVIPEAIQLVSLLPLDAGTQNTLRLALGAASLALSDWLNAAPAPVQTAPATPASSASEASA